MTGGPALSRRTVLHGVTAAAVLTGAGYGSAWLTELVETGLLLRSRTPLPSAFRRSLPIPPVLSARRHPDHPDTDYYELTARPGRLQVLPGRSTRIWGYEGVFPGPTIVSRTGRRTVVRHVNRLPVPTVTHLHGGHTPAASDGFPTDLILPVDMRHDRSMPGMAPDPQAVISEGSREFEYPMRQRAATLWYHDHRMGFTGRSVWQGLAGFHLVRDDEEGTLPLPGGDRELPLMITDRSFEADGAFAYPSVDPSGREPGVTAPYMGGILGDVVLVNGAPWPVAGVDRCLYRLRILNASNARRYGLRLDPAPDGTEPLVQIGSDGGLLEAPVAHDVVEVAAAERFDLLVDFSRWRTGQTVTLLNTLGAGSTARVMQFRVVGDRPEDASIPDRLSRIERLDPAAAAVTRTLSFRRGEGGWTINDAAFDPARSLFNARLGQTEVWNVITDAHHPVHVHLTHFQVVGRRGTPKRSPYDAGWKDTIDLAPAEGATIVLRFDEFAGRFLMHCHNLEHEDMAMMARIDTTR